jgi:hypothetical protein
MSVLVNLFLVCWFLKSGLQSSTSRGTTSQLHAYVRTRTVCRSTRGNLDTRTYVAEYSHFFRGPSGTRGGIYQLISSEIRNHVSRDTLRIQERDWLCRIVCIMGFIITSITCPLTAHNAPTPPLPLCVRFLLLLLLLPPSPVSSPPCLQFSNSSLETPAR